MALFACMRQVCKTSLGKFFTHVAPNTFDAPVFANERKVSVLPVCIGHPAPGPAVFAVTLLTCFLKLAGMRVIVTETAIARHFDKLYLGKSCPLEWDLMTLITF